MQRQIRHFGKRSALSEMPVRFQSELIRAGAGSSTDRSETAALLTIPRLLACVRG